MNINCGGTNGNCIGWMLLLLLLWVVVVIVVNGGVIRLRFPSAQRGAGTGHNMGGCCHKWLNIQRGTTAGGCGYFGMLILVVNEINVTQIGT